MAAKRATVTIAYLKLCSRHWTLCTIGPYMFQLVLSELVVQAIHTGLSRPCTASADGPSQSSPPLGKSPRGTSEASYAALALL